MQAIFPIRFQILDLKFYPTTVSLPNILMLGIYLLNLGFGT